MRLAGWPARWSDALIDRVRGRRILDLNALAGVPRSHPALRLSGGASADVCLLEYNYIDRERSVAGVARLLDLDRTGQVDWSTKTLLLAAKGLHPVGDELVALLGRFREHHVFFGLWNGLREIVELANAPVRNLYYFPVATKLKRVRASAVPVRANGRVFVSLGGDDDLELIGAVVAANPDLEFRVPGVAWAKGSGKRYVDVRLPHRNATPVDCSVVQESGHPVFSPAYVAAYDACDTVLIATSADKMFQMRGGVRIADALYARKHVVMAENAMCQLLMAQHERTCLVFEHDAAHATEHLRRIHAGRFAVDRELYEEIRGLVLEDAQLRCMLRAAAEPDAVRRSVIACPDPLPHARGMLFARGRALLEREVTSLARERR